MKNIKKITKTVAGSALLVGATLAGAASMGAAQSGSSGMTLGDYPAPFVDDDGNVDTSIVVGANAKTVDVVGATNIAGSLSQAAMSEEMVSAEGGSFGWSADAGATLDTRNDQLYFNSYIDDVRQTLTGQHLSALEDYTFEDGDGDETEVEHFLYPGNQQIQYGTDDAEDTDPFVYVNNPANPDSSGHLFKLQANFEDGLAMNSSAVEGEEIDLFGRTYTVSGDTTDSELVLYGSQTEMTVDSGESTTFTVNGEEHTVEVVSVSGDSVAFRIDGTLEEEEEGDSFSVDGQDVRLSKVVDTGDDGAGVVEFSIGSETLTLTGGDVEDADDEDYEGISYETDTGNGGFDDLSTLTFYIGAEDDEHTYVEAGSTYSHTLFENVEFHFGGMNPDAASDDVESVDFSTSGDDTATVSFMSGGEDATVEYAADTSSTPSEPLTLQNGDGDVIHTVEGQNVSEDEYFTSDAGDFAHMWQVTTVDTDLADASETQEATVELTDVVSGQDVTVDMDETAAAGNTYESEEVIDGQTYHFYITNSSVAEEVQVTWGTNSDFGNPGAETSVYAPIDLDSGAAMAFAANTTEVIGNESVVELPSTESTDAKTVDLSSYTDGDVFKVGQTWYQVDDDTNTGTSDVGLGLANSTHPSTLVVEPENDADVENSFTVTPGVNNDDEVEYDSSPSYTGSISSFMTMDSDDDVSAAYNVYGSYAEYDSNDQGSVMLNVPAGQAVAGAAITDADGDLSAGGSSGSVTTMSPTGWPDAAALDTDSNVGSLKSNSNLILVGGPAVNNLVSELASDNKTWSGSDYSQGDQVLDLVSDAFSDGNHALVVAGYSGSDTRAAANYLADYEDNQDELAGQTTLNLATQ